MSTDEIIRLTESIDVAALWQFPQSLGLARG